MIGVKNLKKSDSDHAIAYFNRGYDYGELGEYEKAISDYTKVIELNPEYATAYYYRGICYRKLGEYNKTISDYTEAIELDPDYAQFLITCPYPGTKLQKEISQGKWGKFIDTDFEKNEETTDKWVFTSKKELGGEKNSTQTPGTILLSLPNGNNLKKLNEKQKQIFNKKTAVYKRFITSPFYKFYSTKGVPSAYQIKNNTLEFEDKLTYKGFLSPFEEIKKYDAWYWGSEEMSSPRLINRCEFLDIIPENFLVMKLKFFDLNYFKVFNAFI